MVVQSYDVKTTSSRSSVSIQSTSMLQLRNQNIPQAATQNTSRNSTKGIPQNTLKFDQADTLQLSRRMARSSRMPRHARGRDTGMPTNPHELRAYLMRRLFEQLTGKRSKMPTDATAQETGGESFLGNNQGVSFSHALSFFENAIGISGSRGPSLEGWSVEHFQYESESVSYSAQGVINTADGRTINVDINMYMSRQFVSYMNIDVMATKRPVDPLVINYGGTAASLKGETFSFDLTSDGINENLAILGEGSGFLALDKNGDGKINNGTELFGPNSGCGFGELRAYDKDGNGWIDEADDVFDKLVVWHRDKDGNDTSYTLKELGIGAIYLGDIATEFSFKDESNNTLGIMRSTSFFLKESGGAGTLSHIDLMV